MALWGSQKRYDQDGDGRLNSREWTDWYYGTCGHDLEMAARRKRAQAAKRQPPPPEPIHVFRPEEAWQEIRKTVLGAIPGGAALLPDLGRAAVCEITGALAEGGPPDQAQQEELARLLRQLPEPVDLEPVLEAGRTGRPLFAEASALTETACGSCWIALMARLSDGSFYWDDGPDLAPIWDALGRLHGYFSGTGLAGANIATMERETAFERHWEAETIRHPNLERAARQVRRGVFREGEEDFALELMIGADPALLERYPQKDWTYLTWEEALRDRTDDDPAAGKALWDLLAETAAPALAADKSLAAALLEGSWTAAWQPEAPCAAGRPPASPRKPASREKKPARLSDLPPEDDGTVYRYCQVQLPGNAKPYAYLAGAVPVAVGDWVEVPAGARNQVVRGRVLSVQDCVRSAAPWPPEETKSILRLAAAPEPPDDNPEAPPPAAGGELQEAEPPTRPEPAACLRASRQPCAATGCRTKRPRLLRLAALVLAAALAVGTGFHLWRRTAAYQTGLSYLREGDFRSAMDEFVAAAGFRDADALRRYCAVAVSQAEVTESSFLRFDADEIQLRYETEFQADIDRLEETVRRHAEAVEARREAERAEQEASIRRQYADQLPQDGMAVRLLPYTLLGAPDEVLYCRDYERMVPERRTRTFRWYNTEGQLVASCMAKIQEGDQEETIFAFQYEEDPPAGGKPAASFGDPSWGDPYDVEDSSSAEDFYWDNLEDFGSLDEAERYFDDHRQ